MEKRYAFIRALPSTAYKLKLLASFQGQSMLAVLEHLVTEACQHAQIPVPAAKEGSTKETPQ